MAILGKFIKQPAEILDYDVDFSDWLADRNDTPLSYTAEATAGITLDGSTLTGNVVKVLLSGGTPGRYKITIRLTTDAGLVKEAEFFVTVKEI